jgi:UDP-N-acetylmuramate--alanine ligase
MDINGKLIHFTGIGGVSMSALACFAILNGAYVTGSDSKAIGNKPYLDSLGIISYIGSNPDVAKNADMLVYTSAADINDKEIKKCKEGIQYYPRGL